MLNISLLMPTYDISWYLPVHLLYVAELNVNVCLYKMTDLLIQRSPHREWSTTSPLQYPSLCLLVTKDLKHIELTVILTFKQVGLLFRVFRPTREYFTHLDTSPLPVKGYKFRPILSAHGHYAVRVFNVPHLLWNRQILYNILYPIKNVNC